MPPRPPPSPSSADPSPLPVIAIRQTFLGALDTSLTRTWREEERRWRGEDREWRAQDMEFRVEERDWWHLEHLWRQENRKWRREDIEQRILENARWVWLRHAEKNRRDVEEKSEQLKSISNLSALIGGFAVVAFVELQFSDPNETPERNEGLIVAYAATTALVVALMLNSMVLCSFMLCSILRNGKTYVSDEEEADYLFRCRRFAFEFKVGDAPPRPHRSFERHWETRCEDDWRHAFRMFTCGVPVFLVNVSCMSWLKFHYSPLASWTVTAIAAAASLGWLHTQNNWGFHIAKSQAGNGRNGFGVGATSVGAATHAPAGMPFDWHYRENGSAGGVARGTGDSNPGPRNPTDASRADAQQARHGGARGRGGGRGGEGGARGAEEVVDVVVENGPAPTSPVVPSSPPPPPPPAVRTTRANDVGAEASGDAGVAEGAFTRRMSPRARDLAAGAKAGVGGDEAVRVGSGAVGGGGEEEEEEAGDPFEDAAAELMRRAGDREA